MWKKWFMSYSHWVLSHNYQKWSFNFNYTCSSSHLQPPSWHFILGLCHRQVSYWPEWIAFISCSLQIAGATFDLSWVIWPPALFISRWYQRAFLVYILHFSSKDWLSLPLLPSASLTSRKSSYSKHGINQILLASVSWKVLLFVLERIQCKNLTENIAQHWHFTV